VYSQRLGFAKPRRSDLTYIIKSKAPGNFPTNFCSFCNESRFVGLSGTCPAFNKETGDRREPTALVSKSSGDR